MKKSLYAKQLDSLTRTIERFNKKLEETCQRCGTNEVYLDNSSTCGGLPEFIAPIKIVSRSEEQMHIEHHIGTSVDRCHIRPEKDEDGYTYLECLDDFLEDLNYVKRCVKRGEKFYQSEDPDRFLESDGDEDE